MARIASAIFPSTPADGSTASAYRRISRASACTDWTALRLARALGTTAQVWLNLQNDYDVQIAKRDLGKILDRIETVNKPRAA